MRFTSQLVRQLWSFRLASQYVSSPFVDEKVATALRNAIHNVRSNGGELRNAVAVATESRPSDDEQPLSLDEHASILRLAHQYRAVGKGVIGSANIVAGHIHALRPSDAGWAAGVLLAMPTYTPEELKPALPSRIDHVVARVTAKAIDMPTARVVSLMKHMLLHSETSWTLVDEIVLAKAPSMSASEVHSVYCAILDFVGSARQTRATRLLEATGNALRVLALRALELPMPLSLLEELVARSLAAGLEVSGLREALAARQLDPGNAAAGSLDPASAKTVGDAADGVPAEVIEWLRRAINVVMSLDQAGTKRNRRSSQAALGSMNDLDSEIVVAGAERPLVALHLSHALRNVSRMDTALILQLFSRLMPSGPAPAVDFTPLRPAVFKRLVDLRHSWTFDTIARIYAMLPQFIETPGVVTMVATPAARKIFVDACEEAITKHRQAAAKSVHHSEALVSEATPTIADVVMQMQTFLIEQADAPRKASDAQVATTAASTPSTETEIAGMPPTLLARVALADVELKAFRRGVDDESRLAVRLTARVQASHASTVTTLRETDLVPHLRVLALLPPDLASPMVAELLAERGDPIAERLSQYVMKPKALARVFLAVARAPSLHASRFKILSYCAQVIRSSRGPSVPGVSSASVELSWAHHLPLRFAHDLTAAPSTPKTEEKKGEDAIERERLRHAPTLHFAIEFAVARRREMTANDVLVLVNRLMTLGCTAVEDINTLALAVLNPCADGAPTAASLSTAPPSHSTDAVADLLYTLATSPARVSLPQATLDGCLTRLRVSMPTLQPLQLVRSLFAIRRMGLHAHPTLLAAVALRSVSLLKEPDTTAKHVASIAAELKYMEAHLPGSALAVEKDVDAFCRAAFEWVGKHWGATVANAAADGAQWGVAVAGSVCGMRACPPVSERWCRLIEELMHRTESSAAIDGAAVENSTIVTSVASIAAALGRPTKPAFTPLVEAPSGTPAPAEDAIDPHHQRVVLRCGQWLRRCNNGLTAADVAVRIQLLPVALLIDLSCALARAGDDFSGDVTATAVRVAVQDPILLRMRATSSQWISSTVHRQALDVAGLLRVVMMRGEHTTPTVQPLAPAATPIVAAAAPQRLSQPVTSVVPSTVSQPSRAAVLASQVLAVDTAAHPVLPSSASKRRKSKDIAAVEVVARRPVESPPTATKRKVTASTTKEPKSAAAAATRRRQLTTVKAAATTSTTAKRQLEGSAATRSARRAPQQGR